MTMRLRVGADVVFPKNRTLNRPKSVGGSQPAISFIMPQ